MLDIKFLPLHFSVCLIIGIVLGYFINFSIHAIFVIAFTSFLLLFLFYIRSNSSFRFPLFFALFTGILFVNIGFINTNMRLPKSKKNHYSNSYSPGDRILIQIVSKLKTSAYYYKYKGKVVRVEDKVTEGEILINFDKKDNLVNINIGDMLLSTNELKEVSKALNPNQFDYNKYLKKQGVYHQIRLKKREYKKLKYKTNNIEKIAFKFRNKINVELKKYHFSKENLSLINALLLGQKQDISKETFENFKNAGAIHILAVSGLHIGIILLFLNFVLKPLENLKNGKRLKLILLILILWFYAILAGLSASVVRAVTMFTAIAIGSSINRSSSVQNSLVISIFFLLLIKPLLLFDLGFQLSYTAVFSIIWINPLLHKLVDPKIKIFRYFWQLLSLSLAAQIGLLPLSLYYFHQFPGLFFVSSLIIIPFLGFLLGLGIIVIILSLINLLPQFLANFYDFSIGLMTDIVQVISNQEYFIFRNISFSVWMMLGFYFLIVATINFLNNKKILDFSFFLGAIILVQFVLIYEKNNMYRSNEFIVFHQFRSSLIGNKRGNKLKLYTQNENLTLNEKEIINDYSLGFPHELVRRNSNFSNVMNFQSNRILLIDSLGIFNMNSFNPETIILTQSPKINLERLIDRLGPKLIIADGSNYKSDILRWKNTCNKERVNFYSTFENGAIKLK